MKQIRKIFNETPKMMRVILLLIYYAIAVALAEFLALLTRFEFSVSQITSVYLDHALYYVAINIVVTIVIFAFLKLYNSLWKYASVQEMLNVFVACALAAGSQSIGMHMLLWDMPRSYYILYFFFLLALICMSRFFYRGVRVVRNSYVSGRDRVATPTMIIGAGDTASFLIKDMNTSVQLKNRVVCVIDADPHKIGNHILGAPIVGDDSQIPDAGQKYGVREIFIAIPNLPAVRKKAILELCKDTGCRIKILPSMAQIVNDEVCLSNFREV